MTSKKQTGGTVGNSFLNLVFLNFLNVRKDYYKPQQFDLKSPAENDTVSFSEPASFLQKKMFRNIFKKAKIFLKF